MTTGRSPLPTPGSSLGVGSFTPKIEAALMALGELLETLSDSPHPQEFGMDGCPVCKARDAIGEAVVSVQDVQDHLRLWMPDA